MVGLIPDLSKVCPQGWQAEGDLIYLLGLPSKSKIELGASEYLATIHDTVAGKPPRVDFDLERCVQTACREGIRQGWVRSAHDCAEGGLALALAEACISGKLGAEINLGITSNQLQESSQRLDEVLFGEGGARILVSVCPEYQQVWESYLTQKLDENWQKIGQVSTTDTFLRVFTDENQRVIDVTIKSVSDRFFNAIERRLTTSASIPI